MRQSRSLLVLSIVVCIISICTVEPSIAQSGTEPLDLVLIIDHSGSMENPKYGRSDPHSMRFLAARMLIDLLNDEDRVGLILFSDNAEDYSNGLQLVQTGRGRLKENIAKMESQSTGDQTRYKDALELAEKLLGETPANRRAAVIFLTDGAPTDMKQEEDYSTALDPFIDRDVPVYLLMLEPKKFDNNAIRNETLQRIGKTLQIFRDNKQPVIEIGDPASIARAFAEVITDLQPGVYIDVENPRGNPDRYQTIFQASVASSQRVADITFVFYPSKGIFDQKLNITEQQIPNGVKRDNTPRDNTPGSESYVTVRYRADVGTNIVGAWQFAVNAPTESISAFTFVRSDIRIRPRYPGLKNPALIRGQNALIGFTVDGVLQTQDVRLRVNLQQCPLDGRDQADSRVLPLEKGPDTTLWTILEDIGKDSEYVYVTVEFVPVNALSLWKCFTVRVLPNDPKMNVTITSVEQNADGSFTVEANLPEGHKNTSMYVTGPSNYNDLVPFDGNRVRTKPLPTSGEYIVKVIAEGEYLGFNVALVDQQPVIVSSFISLNESESQLAPTVRCDDRLLEGTIVLNAPFLLQPDEVRFRVSEILRDGRSVNTLSESSIALCPQGFMVADKKVRCPFQINLPDGMEAGQYRVNIKVESDKQKIMFQSIPITFTVPQTGINLSNAVINFDEPITPLRPVAQTDVVIVGCRIGNWPSIEFIVESVRDRRSNQTYPGSVELEEPKLSREGDILRYQLYARFSDSLPPSEYEVSVQLKTDPPVMIKPSPRIVMMGVKKSTVVELTAPPSDTFSAIWGFWLPFWQPTFTIPLTATVSFDDKIPVTYHPPIVQLVEKDTERYSSDTFVTQWIDEARISNDTFIKTVELRLNRWLFFNSGTYTVTLTSDPVFSRNNMPKQLVVQVQVYGLWEYLWKGVVPAIIGLGVVLFLLYIFPVQHGRIIVDGKEVKNLKKFKELRITILPSRKIKVSSPSGHPKKELRLGKKQVINGKTVEYKPYTSGPVQFFLRLLLVLMVSPIFAFVLS